MQQLISRISFAFNFSHLEKLFPTHVFLKKYKINYCQVDLVDMQLYKIFLYELYANIGKQKTSRNTLHWQFCWLSNNKY